MTYQFLTPVNMTGLEVRDVRAEAVGALPTANASQTSRYLYHTGLLKYCDGTRWIILGEAGAGGPPTGPASGELMGTYPSPQIAPGVIADSEVSASADIAQSKIYNLVTDLANKVSNTRSVIAGNGLVGGGTLAGDVTLNVGAGTGIVVAADTVSLDTIYADGRYVNMAGDTMSGALVLSGNPANPLEAAPTQYVDLATQGFSFKNACRVVATGNVTQSGLAAIDGVTPGANDRILCAGQTTASQNGIFLAASGAWTRAVDMDASGELVDGTLVPVAEGTTNADSQWMCTAVGATPWVPGSSTSTWTRFSGLADLVAGNGLTKTGNTINVVGDATLSVAADLVSVLTAPKWSTARSITLTGDVTGSAASVDGSANVSITTTLVGGTVFAKKFAADVPAGTACTVTHNLGTRDVNVAVYRNSTPWDTVLCDIERPDVNNVTLRFATAVTAGQYRVTVGG